MGDMNRYHSVMTAGWNVVNVCFSFAEKRSGTRDAFFVMLLPRSGARSPATLYTSKNSYCDPCG